MIFYYSVFIVIFLFALLGEKTVHEKWCLFIMAFIMTMMQGLRWNTGADWTQFYTVFERITWSNYLKIYHGEHRYLEVGYSFLNILFKTFFGHYTAFLLFTCGLINFTFARTVWRYVPRHKTLCLALILALSPLFPVRNALAGTIILWGIPYILKKDWKSYALVVLMSVSIHSMGIIGILFYWIDKHISNRNIWIAYLISPFITSLSAFFQFMASIPILRELVFIQMIDSYNSSFNSFVTNTSFNWGYYTFYALILYLAIQYRDQQQKGNLQFINICLNMFVIMLIIRNISAHGNTVFEITRMNYFTTIGFPILFVLGVFDMLQKKKIPHDAIRLLFFLYMLYRVRGLQFDYYSFLFIPYYSVFQDSPVRDFWFGFI